MSKKHNRGKFAYVFAQASAFALGIVLTCITTLFFLIVGVALQDIRYKDVIYPNVVIDGYQAKGLSPIRLAQSYEKVTQNLTNTLLELRYAKVPVATYSGQMVRVKHSGPTITTQAYLIGRQGDMLTRAKEKLQILLSLKKFVFTTHLEYDDDVLYRESLDLLAKQYDIVPKNALFELENGKVKTFAKETEGLRIDTTKALSQIRHAWTSRVSHASNDPIVIDIESHTVTPDITLENSSVHGIKEIIGEGTSDYTHSIPGRIHNLLLASDKLHGILIPKGATFSYNEAIGEISARTGYQPAYVIVNGRTELGDGGGVCQTSTTIFRAALNSGLPITEWHAHAYRVGYYENDSKPGRDATIYTPSVDLKFTNDTAASILIQVQKDLAHNKLTYRFWGTKDDRNITISDVSTSGALPAPPPRYQDDPTLAKGIIKQVDWSASGLTAWFDYHVTRADGSLIQKKTFTSVYRPWQAVYLVGTRE